MAPLLPVYYQIKQAIKNWIVNKDFKPGEKIPSENELAGRFNVSRLTVRQAIYQLVQEGFLKSKRGEGTFVTNNETLIDNFGLEFIGFMDDLFYQVSKVKTVSAMISRVPSPKFVSEKLELKNENEEVISIRRVRFLRDKVFSYTVNYLPLPLGLKINEKELYKKALMEIVEHDLGIQFTEAFQTIQASFANQEIAGQLGIPSGSPILYVERVMYTKGRKPVEFVQSSHPGDMYKYIVRLKNVKTKNERVWVHKLGIQDAKK